MFSRYPDQAKKRTRLAALGLVFSLCAAVMAWMGISVAAAVSLSFGGLLLGIAIFLSHAGFARCEKAIARLAPFIDLLDLF